jgi:response regulator RpfG family c-di-GMP phosphodiesterase
LVDDERTILDAGAITLNRSGYIVSATADPHEAISLALQEPFDLLLCDLVLPGLGGIEVLRTIKSLYPDIAAVIITGYGSMQSAIEALHSGADGFLLKPFSTSELRNAVEEALTKRRALKESHRLKALMPLFESSKAFYAELSLDRLTAAVVEQFARSVHANHVALLLGDPASPEGTFHLEAVFPTGDHPSVPAEAVQWVAQTHEALTLNGENGGRAGNGTGSVLYAPLQAAGALLGIVRVEKRGDNTGFSDAETEIVAIQSSQAAIALKNALLLREQEESYLQAMGALANALDPRDPGTFGHNDRVAKNAVLIAQTMGLGHDVIEAVHAGSLLHDIGKVGVPSEVLLKPARLTSDEFALVKRHPLLGDIILAPLPALQRARPVVLNHHEWFDATGYPNQVGGDDIPLIARIVSVADAFAAVTESRPHRSGQSVAKAIRAVREGRGTQFDPKVVDAFFEVLHQAEHNDEEPTGGVA